MKKLKYKAEESTGPKLKKSKKKKKEDPELNERSVAMRPMTPAEYKARREEVKRVQDDTGRWRLVRGDGEVLEEIVSRDRHLAINKQATRGDGEGFLKTLNLDKK